MGLTSECKWQRFGNGVEEVGEFSYCISEWEKLLEQHKVCEKPGAGNQKRIVDLDKQIREVQELVHKENHWSLGFVSTEANQPLLV